MPPGAGPAGSPPRPGRSLSPAAAGVQAARGSSGSRPATAQPSPSRSLLATVATCSLDQWALDFAGNLRRTERSIALAKARGATLRVGPELELCGYGCEDHLLELDTYDHAWEALAELLRGEASAGCLLDVGMPVMHAGVRYNCRVFVLNGRILLVRPKKHLADDGNYREGRFFTAWGRPGEVEELALPAVVREVAGQARCPIGDALVETNDTVIASETCEELFTPASPHIAAGLNGAEIFTNGSGSHHRLRKLDQRVDLVRNASAKSGGVYLYANQRGCDGGRLYFDGSALVAVNGAFVAQGPQFALGEVDVVTAVVDLAEVRAFRCRFSSRSAQAAEAARLPRVRVDFDVCAHPVAARLAPSAPLAIHYSDPMEEIARGPAAWLWDYLRRSGARGFFLPLSGGADSAATLAICGSMCQEVHRAVQLEVPGVLEDLRRVLEQPATWEPESAQELAGQLLHTCYMGSKQSSPATKARAAALAGEVGAHHLALSIDGVVTSLISLFSAATGRCPRFEAQGGSRAEDLALQNLQARSRMVVGYLLAQLLPWVRWGSAGGLLVLGSSNVDEALRGYLTKYDCSSADLNPIGSISKEDLRAFLKWGEKNLGYPTLAEVLRAPPSAELRPPAPDGRPQEDENEMGMTYAELGTFGRLRKLGACGPVSMYRKLLGMWGHLSATEVAEKVKRFWGHYARNRHKATVLTPAYHAEDYSPEDHRFDLRPFLLHAAWPWQFRKIDELAAEVDRQAAAVGGDSSSPPSASGSGSGSGSGAGSGSGSGSADSDDGWAAVSRSEAEPPADDGLSAPSAAEPGARAAPSVSSTARPASSDSSAAAYAAAEAVRPQTAPGADGPPPAVDPAPAAAGAPPPPGAGSGSDSRPATSGSRLSQPASQVSGTHLSQLSLNSSAAALAVTEAAEEIAREFDHSS